MNELNKKPYYHIIFSHLVICTFLPLGLLIGGSFIWDTLEKAINVYYLIILAILGIGAGIAYNYKKTSILATLEKNNESMTNWASISLKFLLFLPLCITISIIVLITQNEDMHKNNALRKHNLELELAAQNEKKVKKNELMLNKEHDETPLSKSKFVLFEPDLESLVTVKNQLLGNVFNIFKANNPVSKLSQDELAVAKKIATSFMPFLMEGKWEDLLRFVDEKAGSNPQIATTVINVAANIADVPLDVLMELANRGGVMSSHSLLGLLQKGEFETVITLENYGSSLQGDFLENTNIFHLALLTPLEPEAFDFLISRVDVINETGELGVDTLGMAIVNADANPTHISYYLNEMIRNGATVQPQHLKLMAGLKRDSGDIYEEIVLAVPELQIN